MSETDEQAQEPESTEQEDRTPLEKPEVGLIADEDLPEELRPNDDNPLAQSPEEQQDQESTDVPKVEGMPDLEQPG